MYFRQNSGSGRISLFGYLVHEMSDFTMWMPPIYYT